MMTPALKEWFSQYGDVEIISLIRGDIEAHLAESDTHETDNNLSCALELLDFLKERIGVKK